MTYRTAPSRMANAIAYACPIASVERYFPRPHPSVSTVFKLGLGSLGLGAVAGVPAILLGGLVLREIAAANGRYTGEDEAKAGLWLGWVSTLLSCSLLVYWVSSSSLAAGLTCAAAGCLGVGTMALGWLWSGAPRFVRSLAAQPLATTGPLWAAALLLVVAGDAGIYVKRHTDEEARRKAAGVCAAESSAANQAIDGGRFDDARVHAGLARVACVGTMLAQAAEIEASIPEREAAHEQRLAREHAERLEQVAAADFEARVEGVRARLEAATMRASQARWLEARAELDLAERTLRDFVGTKVGASERWMQLSARLNELRTEFAPSIEKADRVRKEEEEVRRKREAVVEAAKRRQEEASEKAREAAEAARESTRRVVCCDGTVSRSCLCAANSHRGCCSRHGGVCGCQD